MAERIKQWYEKGWWSKEMVRNALGKNIITQQQYNEITEQTL